MPCDAQPPPPPTELWPLAYTHFEVSVPECCPRAVSGFLLSQLFVTLPGSPEEKHLRRSHGAGPALDSTVAMKSCKGCVRLSDHASPVA